VSEQGTTTDTYTVRLAAAPEHDKPVYINVSRSTHHAGRGRRLVAGDSVLIKAGGTDFGRYLVLKFDDTNWNTAQTVTVKAVDDHRIEGERVYAISHSAQSADARFDHAAIKNVKVTVFDNDKPEVIVAAAAIRTRCSKATRPRRSPTPTRCGSASGHLRHGDGIARTSIQRSSRSRVRTRASTQARAALRSTAPTGLLQSSCA